MLPKTENFKTIKAYSLNGFTDLNYSQPLKVICRNSIENRIFLGNEKVNLDAIKAKVYLCKN